MEVGFLSVRYKSCWGETLTRKANRSNEKGKSVCMMVLLGQGVLCYCRIALLDF